MSRRVQLRPLVPGDQASLERWLMGWEGLYWFQDAPGVLTGPESVHAAGGPFAFIAESAAEPRATLGLVSLTEYSPSHRRACIDVVLDSSARGKGIGVEAALVLLHYAFSVLNLNKVGARVRRGNGAAIGGLQRLGFVEEGTLREHVQRGNASVDVLLFGLTATEYWSSSVLAVLRQRALLEALSSMDGLARDSTFPKQQQQGG